MGAEAAGRGHLLPLELLEKFLLGLGELGLAVRVLQEGVIGARVVGVVEPEGARGRRRPRLLSQDGGSSGRVLQCWEPGVVPDVPGAAAAGRGGSFRLPVQNAGFKMSLFQWKAQPCRHLAHKLTVCFRSGNN